jgi:hypothetical protein
MVSDKKQHPLVGAFFLFLGLIFLILGIYLMYSDYSLLKSWKQVKAVVINYSDEIDYDSDNILYSTPFFLSYPPCLDYMYSINGPTYNGSYCSSSRSTKEEIEKFIKRYHPGSSIDVLVDPKDPQNSRVKDDVNPFNWANLMIVGMGVLSMLVGAISTYLSSSRRS